MILGKLWQSLRAQFNKLANWFRGRDPIAEMTLDRDQKLKELLKGREGLERQRGLVERVARQVAEGRKHIESLTAKVKSYLSLGERETAAQLVLELQRVEAQVGENESQLKLHEESYRNNVIKLQHATKKVAEMGDRIAQYDATLRLSRTEAEIAELTRSFDFDVTTELGQVERIVQDQIDANHAKVRVAADLSGVGVEIAERAVEEEKRRAELALQQFEMSH